MDHFSQRELANCHAFLRKPARILFSLSSMNRYTLYDCQSESWYLLVRETEISSAHLQELEKPRELFWAWLNRTVLIWYRTVTNKSITPGSTMASLILWVIIDTKQWIQHVPANQQKCVMNFTFALFLVRPQVSPNNTTLVRTVGIFLSEYFPTGFATFCSLTRKLIPWKSMRLKGQFRYTVDKTWTLLGVAPHGSS